MRRFILLATTATLAIACQEQPAPDAVPQPVASASASATASAAIRPPSQELIPGGWIEIPGGSFMAGSVPGDPGRLPELEPRRYEVELGPFSIGRLPYPNRADRPPLTGITRDEAKRKCAAEGARLCTELEWERACKGPGSDDFITGEKWDMQCTKTPNECASGFDVLAMGAAMREWVASNVGAKAEKNSGQAVVRGGAASAPPSAHRCAQRRALDADTSSADLGFRCCKGAPNAAKIPEPQTGTTFEKTRLPTPELKELLEGNERTRSLAKDLVYFREPDAARTVLARGPGDDQGFLFTVSPMLWRPVAGAEYLLISARSGKNTSFVLAYHVLGEGKYKLASSFIMYGEPGPIAFAYNGYIRPRLHFSNCWGCPGETGKILHRDPDSVVILQP